MSTSVEKTHFLDTHGRKADPRGRDVASLAFLPMLAAPFGLPLGISIGEASLIALLLSTISLSLLLTWGRRQRARKA